VAGVSLTSSVATDVAKSFLGPIAVKAMAAGLLVSVLGSLFTGILTGARIPYAMATDRIFFPGLARLSEKTRVPVNALIVQWGWVCLLALSGSFDTLTDYAMFAAWIFYGFATASVFVFRKRNPEIPRPYRAVGYPAVPVVFILVTIFLLLNTIWTAPAQSLIGLAIIFLGLPLYRYWARK
jgi:APA family basic amino acid/polyamine antiporter